MVALYSQTRRLDGEIQGVDGICFARYCCLVGERRRCTGRIGRSGICRIFSHRCRIRRLGDGEIHRLIFDWNSKSRCLVDFGRYCCRLSLRFYPFSPDLMGAPAAEASTVKTAVTESGITWQPFTIEELDKNITANKTVFLDFTADWCLTCKVNERTVLSSAPVIDQLKALNVVTMKADWTRRDATISKIVSQVSTLRSAVSMSSFRPERGRLQLFCRK